MLTRREHFIESSSAAAAVLLQVPATASSTIKTIRFRLYLDNKLPRPLVKNTGVRGSLEGAKHDSATVSPIDFQKAQNDPQEKSGQPCADHFVAD